MKLKTLENLELPFTAELSIDRNDEGEIDLVVSEENVGLIIGVTGDTLKEALFRFAIVNSGLIDRRQEIEDFVNGLN